MFVTYIKKKTTDMARANLFSPETTPDNYIRTSLINQLSLFVFIRGRVLKFNFHCIRYSVAVHSRY